jgi:hypothetical protein
MADRDLMAAWVKRVLSIDVAGAGGAAQAPDLSKSHDLLTAIREKIPDHAVTAAQENLWRKRADMAQDLLDEDDPDAAPIIRNLDAEITAVARRQSAADAPFLQWQKVYGDCRQQVSGLKPVLQGQLAKAGLSDQVPAFEAGWATLEQELTTVGDIIRNAFRKAKRAAGAERIRLMSDAGDLARGLIRQSTLLSKIDGSREQPVSVVASLNTELDHLEQSFKG